MRFPIAVFLLLISSIAAVPSSAQVPASKPSPSPATAPVPPAQAAPAGAQPSAPPPAAPPSGPAATLQPALDTVTQTLSVIATAKWKKGNVREEANDHIGVIQRDLKETMPPLLTSADAAPNTVSALLPLSRNVDAVYDILLSVVEAARVSGPPAQVTELDQALRGLNAARVTFDEHLQQASEAAEKQIADLQATVKVQAAFKCPVLPPPVIPVCPAPPAPKKPVHHKPKPPAATTTPGSAAAPTAKTSN